MHARFTEGGSSFSVAPEKLRSWFFVPEASLSWRVSERLAVSVSYQARLGKYETANTGFLSVSLEF